MMMVFVIKIRWFDVGSLVQTCVLCQTVRGLSSHFKVATWKQLPSSAKGFLLGESGGLI